MLIAPCSVRVVGNANSANYTIIYAESDKYMMKTIRDYINLIENAQREEVVEGWVDTIKNIFKRKPRDNRTVFEKDPEAMREFERSGGYEAGLDIMGWQIGWFAAEHAQGDTMNQAFSKLYYGGGSPLPFDNRSFKLAWVAYNKHHGPQVAMEQDIEESGPDAIAKINELTRR